MAIVIRRKVAAPVAEPVVKEVRPARTEPARLLDGMCRTVMDSNPNNSVAWWLMASYLYYHHHISILSDELYDDMAKAMLEAWDDLEHMHKHLITKEHLRAGTLFDVAARDYPTLVRAGASQLVGTALGITLNIMH